MNKLVIPEPINEIDKQAEQEGKALRRFNDLRPQEAKGRDVSKRIVFGGKFDRVPEYLINGWFEAQVRKQRQLENSYSFRLSY